MIFTIKIWIADIPSSDIKVYVELVKLALLHVTLLVRSLRKHYHQNIGIIKKLPEIFTVLKIFKLKNLFRGKSKTYW